ncbi:hypothetical protein [Deinococcus multiflagellatus]|uniref:Uncharacterized protein n=1 Tax=Deinococcus multiflagellatus TaxID=1656887 RepID=A0ABW1ZV62_9DEIO
MSVALERADQARQLTGQRDALNRRAQELETLLHLTEDQGETADPLALIGRAQGLILKLLPPGFALYYEAQGPLAGARSDRLGHLPRDAGAGGRRLPGGPDAQLRSGDPDR